MEQKRLSNRILYNFVYSSSSLFAVISFRDLPQIKKSSDKYCFAVYNRIKPWINIYPRISGKTENKCWNITKPLTIFNTYSRFFRKPRISIENGERFCDISTLIRGFFRKSVDKYLFAVFWKSAKKKVLGEKTANKQIRE